MMHKFVGIASRLRSRSRLRTPPWMGRAAVAPPLHAISAGDKCTSQGGCLLYASLCNSFSPSRADCTPFGNIRCWRKESGAFVSSFVSCGNPMKARGTCRLKASGMTTSSVRTTGLTFPMSSVCSRVHRTQNLTYAVNAPMAQACGRRSGRR